MLHLYSTMKLQQHRTRTTRGIKSQLKQIFLQHFWDQRSSVTLSILGPISHHVSESSSWSCLDGGHVNPQETLLRASVQPARAPRRPSIRSNDKSPGGLATRVTPLNLVGTFTPRETRSIRITWTSAFIDHMLARHN